MKKNVYHKFLDYASKVGDFEDGECNVDVCSLDEVILGAMLESYFIYAYQLGMRDLKKAQKEAEELAAFNKQQPPLPFGDSDGEN